MFRGYIKLWRKSLDSPVWKNHDLWRFWCWCLMKATHAPLAELVGYQCVPLKPGEFVFGRKVAARETGLSERTVRTCIDTLSKLGNLTINSTNKFSILTIEKWEDYQSSDQQTTSKATNKRPASDHKQAHQEHQESKSTDNSGSEPSCDKQPKEDRPSQCSAETWTRYMRISRGFHSEKATQLGARAPLTDANVLDGAKALDNLIRIKGRPEDEVLAILGWSIEDPFWSVNLRSIKALLKTSNNGELKYSNVLTSMTRDLERRAERSMAANG